MRLPSHTTERAMQIRAGASTVRGELTLPAGACGLVVFADGGLTVDQASGQRYVMRALTRGGLGTLLLRIAATPDHGGALRTRARRLDVALLAERLVYATQWVRNDASLSGMRIGYYVSGAASTAALVAAAGLAGHVGAVVMLGGRPDLAGVHLERVTAATLLVVGGADRAMIDVSERAYEKLQCVKRLEVVERATHRFVESGALEEVATLATDWFQSHLEAAVRA